MFTVLHFLLYDGAFLSQTRTDGRSVVRLKIDYIVEVSWRMQDAALSQTSFLIRKLLSMTHCYILCIKVFILATFPGAFGPPLSS